MAPSGQSDYRTVGRHVTLPYSGGTLHAVAARKKEEGRRKREGRKKKEDGRRKTEEVRQLRYSVQRTVGSVLCSLDEEEEEEEEEDAGDGMRKALAQAFGKAPHRRVRHTHVTA